MCARFYFKFQLKVRLRNLWRASPPLRVVQFFCLAKGCSLGQTVCIPKRIYNLNSVISTEKVLNLGVESLVEGVRSGGRFTLSVTAPQLTCSMIDIML